MLTIDSARKIGIRACVDAIGYDFCMKYKDNAASAYGREGENLYCYVGVDDEPFTGNAYRLDSKDKFKYSASCHVRFEDGVCKILSCVKPGR